MRGRGLGRYNNLRGVLTAHLQARASMIAKHRGHEDMVEELRCQWKTFKTSMQMLHDVFLYLDRAYVEKQNVLPTFELGMTLFRDHVAREVRIQPRVCQRLAMAASLPGRRAVGGGRGRGKGGGARHPTTPRRRCST